MGKQGLFSCGFGDRKGGAQKLVQIAAEDVFASPAIEAFGACIPETDGAVLVAHDDGFGSKLEEFGSLAVVGFALTQRFRAFGDDALKVGIEALELEGLAMELDEDADFGAQDLGNYGDGDVIDGAAAVAVDLVLVGEVDARDEDDSGFAEAGMLADHVGELEAVEFGHADVHEDDSDVVLEEDIEGLFGGRGLDEVLAEVAEDDLIAEELGGLVVHHEDVDFLIWSHRSLRPHPILSSGAATCAAPTATVRCSRAWQDIPMRPLQGIFRGRLSWLWQ